MRKVVLLLVVGLLATLNAHSGGTDSSGCHYNHKTGGYHCHRSDSNQIDSNKIAIQNPIKEETVKSKEDTHTHDHS